MAEAKQSAGLTGVWKFVVRFARRAVEAQGRMVFFLAVALVAHVIVFYLFRVDYPAVERWIPQTTGVTLLTDSSPRAAWFLRDLDDRLFHLEPGASTSLTEYSLESRGVRFRPSFAGFAIDLKEGANLQDRRAAAPTLYAAGRPVLPPLKTVEQDKPESSSGEELDEAPFQFKIRLSGSLRGRDFRVDEASVEELMSGRPSGRVTFRAGVLPDGRVPYLLPAVEAEAVLSDGSSEWGGEEIDRLRRSIRFEAAADERWGWLELTW